MKQVVNFRLNQQAVSILTLLEKRLHTTKTAVVEAALVDYAKHKLAERHELLAYAGILADDEAEAMLKDIYTSRRDKKKEIKW